MPETAIKIDDISKVYRLYDNKVDRLRESLHPFRKKYHRDFYALRNVSLDIKKGETVGIIGKNGSGKSTLLQIISGVLKPARGSVAVHGRVLALLELGAGFNPEMTGLENIYFNGALMGATKEEMDGKIERIIDFADIGEFVYQPVKTYSSGMYVRLAFSVIANMDADILVIDEALAVGDVFFVQKCMRFLRKFQETGTLVFVSHDTGAITNLCHRAVWLDKGQVKDIGPPKEISEKYIEAFYEYHQGGSANHITRNEDYSPFCEEEFKDQRLDVVNASPYRNDIEIFKFDPDTPSFGKHGADIIDVKMLDERGEALSWVVGGEIIHLVIKCRVNIDLKSPIVGFFIKDHLGQTLFGENTFLTYMSRPVRVFGEEILQAKFTFRMPLLPVGDYSISVAIADGTQEDHIQHHWFHDALVFKSHASIICHGLLGLPMRKIQLSVIR